MDDIFHYARHTFATKMLRNGYNCTQVGRMIGDSAAMIEKVYGHPTHDDVISQTFNTHQPTVKSADEEVKDVLVMLGCDTLDVDAMDNVTAWEELTRKHNELFNIGVDLSTIKEIFNKNLTLKEKRDLVKKILDEIKEKGGN